MSAPAHPIKSWDRSSLKRAHHRLAVMIANGIFPQNSEALSSCDHPIHCRRVQHSAGATSLEKGI